MKLHQKLFWLLVFLLPLQLGRHFWPSFSLILGLRVDYLSPTLYFTDILVMAILGLWGWEELKVKNEKLKITIKDPKLFFLSLAVFFFLLVNSLLAQNSGAALYKLAKIIEFSLLGFYIARNIRISQYSNILISLSLAVIYSSLIAIVQFIKQSSLGGPLWWLGERTFNLTTPGIAKAVVGGRLVMRPYGTFPHPNALAGFLLISLILLQNASDGGPRGLRGEGIKKILYWLAMILGIITITLSFSRSVWVVSLLICLWLVIQCGKKIKIKKSMLYALYAMFFIIFSLLVYFGSQFSTNEAFFQRTQLMKASLLMIKDSPLSGVGLNNFLVYLPNFWPLTGFTYWLQPVHNIYLLIAAETGIVGLVIFLWFLFLTFKNLLKIGNWELEIALLAILLLGVTDHYWLTLQQTQLLLTLVLGLIWSSKN